MQIVRQWMRFETCLESSEEYPSNAHQLRVRVAFSHEERETQGVDAFWDGFRTWRVRFMPDRPGKWNWLVQSSDKGLNGKSGEFRCEPYMGDNLLYRHGAVRVASSGRNFEFACGTPFFWLGDTVWNGPLKATLEDWTCFLSDREDKGFNLIQFVPTQWVAGAGNADLRTAYVAAGELRIDPFFFQWLDRRIDLINEFGMIACPALIWAAPSKEWALPLNPGTSLSDDHIIALAAYMVARYGAHHVIWMLAGDGDYRGEKAARWKRIGQAVFGGSRHLATMHPMGQIWAGHEFGAESWFRFHGYQSSHWDHDDAWRWITNGPPSTEWARDPPRPVVNMEPCYEAHLDMTNPLKAGRRAFDGNDVRRACYWSLLVSPPAGVTYGASGVWSWELSPQPPMNHFLTGVAPPWREAMELPGSRSMKVLRQVFESVAWWTLVPSPELILEQPCEAKAFIAGAKSASGDLAVIYTPGPAVIKLRTDRLKSPFAAEWVDPVSGRRQDAIEPFETPGAADWVLILRG